MFLNKSICIFIFLVSNSSPLLSLLSCSRSYYRTRFFSSNYNDGINSFIERRSRPSHINIPRIRLDLPFAVQLMRTSYNAVDELNFIAMDDFQKSFFLFRQSEWEEYRDKHPNIIQGDLSDPYYFDFISFAQYATISDKCKIGKLQFVEKVNIHRICMHLVVYMKSISDRC